MPAKKRTKISVRSAKPVLIRNGSDRAHHVVSQPVFPNSTRHQVVLGFPLRGFRWSMWQATKKPQMRMFGIQIEKEWYVLTLRKNGRCFHLARRRAPNMVSPNSSDWFEYKKILRRGVYVLRHKKSRAYITTSNNQIKPTSSCQSALSIDIKRV